MAMGTSSTILGVDLIHLTVQALFSDSRVLDDRGDEFLNQPAPSWATLVISRGR